MLLGAGLVAVVFLAGCTTAQKGAVAGGAVGAGTGAIIANNAGILNSTEGAGVGLAAGGLVGALVGDAIDENQTRKREQEMQAQIGALQGELAGRDRDVASIRGELAGKDRAVVDMQAELERLRAELGGQRPEVKVESVNGTIRFTILDEVLFDSGKADLKKEGLATLDSVLKVTERDFPGRLLVVEGHTDADPIKHSAWKSNWELSAGRSLAVVHYLVEKKGVGPERVSAQAFGQYRPVAPNDTTANKRQNRRAVIVVMPPEQNIIVERK
jgi:flagellar motor protein MotB